MCWKSQSIRAENPGIPTDFLRQYGRGGRIFSMMDGLASVGQAALFLGNYDVVAFEKDRTIWTEAKNVLDEWVISLKQKEAKIAKAITQRHEVLHFHFHLQYRSKLNFEKREKIKSTKKK